jgi:undecaprenyl diphosphate synthase
MSFFEKINKEKLPKHIAIIMDGNGRWAKKQGKIRIFGHNKGVETVKEITEACAKIGIQHLTLYAFSTENWNRPKREVDALMKLLVSSIKKEINTLHDNNIRLYAIGDIKSLPAKTRKELQKAIEETQHHDRMQLNLALSYSSKWEITEALRNIAAKVKDGSLKIEEISEKTIDQHLTTNGIPDPELMIRTSGEQRLSNYLLWQLAYAEFVFSPKLWPDYSTEDLYENIYDYQNRERRFGKTSEQL